MLLYLVQQNLGSQITLNFFSGLEKMMPTIYVFCLPKQGECTTALVCFEGLWVCFSWQQGGQATCIQKLYTSRLESRMCFIKCYCGNAPSLQSLLKVTCLSRHRGCALFPPRSFISHVRCFAKSHCSAGPSPEGFHIASTLHLGFLEMSLLLQVKFHHFPDFVQMLTSLNFSEVSHSLKLANVKIL